MMIRKRLLPPGWYPEEKYETVKILDEWAEKLPVACGYTGVKAVVVPHAGWFYSGEIAFSAIGLLESPETVVVVGGHLAPHDKVVVHMEDSAETPVGILDTHTVLRDEIVHEFHASSDTTPDNTVEIHLPIVKYLFPSARYVGVRISPTKIATELGNFLSDYSSRVGENIVFVGSTDLTHYGNAYGFTPSGSGKRAIRWAEENDRRFLDTLVRMDLDLAISDSRENRSACSAGAAVAAGAYAIAQMIERGYLLGYQSSVEKGSSDSFVGYGAVIYGNRDKTQSA